MVVTVQTETRYSAIKSEDLEIGNVYEMESEKLAIYLGKYIQEYSQIPNNKILINRVEFNLWKDISNNEYTYLMEHPQDINGFSDFSKDAIYEEIYNYKEAFITRNFSDKSNNIIYTQLPQDVSNKLKNYFEESEDYLHCINYYKIIQRYKKLDKKLVPIENLGTILKDNVDVNSIVIFDHKELFKLQVKLLMNERILLILASIKNQISTSYPKEERLKMSLNVLQNLKIKIKQKENIIHFYSSKYGFSIDFRISLNNLLRNYIYRRNIDTKHTKTDFLTFYTDAVKEWFTEINKILN